MFGFFFFLSTAVVVALSGCFTFREYRRVKKRDAARRRIQTHPGKAPSPCDPLDHSLYWYPVAFSHELPRNASRPFGFHLLNEPLCLYRRNDGEAICVLDLCPHRSAPLSLGQVTKEGNLECFYHGWQFGAQGQCVYIPSVSKESSTASLVCARTVPVHEQYGFIWIWPGKRELADSVLIPHRLFEGLQGDKVKFILSPESVCNLDIPYELMVDNLVDFAHIDFTHDGTIGKRSQACWTQSKRVTPGFFSAINAESFSYRIERHEKSSSDSGPTFSHIHFLPPCFVRMEHNFSDKGKVFVQLFFIIPTEEKKMRLLLQFYRNFFCYKWIEYIPGYDYFMQKFNMKVVDQDIRLLNGIERNITNMGAKALGTTVSADAPIRAFRRYQTRAAMKFETIYTKKRSWATTSKTESDEPDEIDIEDLKME